VTSSFEICARAIGPDAPPYIVAEMSANHQQDFDRAVRIVQAAHDAGADAVKLQTYTPDTMTIDCTNDHFRITGTPWNGRRLYELYEEAYMPWEWYERLRAVAEECGMHLFSTPFDCSAVDYLERRGAPAYKIASFELTDLPLLRRVARTRKPIMVSTGMGSLAEIREATDTLRAAGCRQLALLKCTSAYPAPAREMHLRTIPHLAETFGVPVGISDHTLEPAVTVAAVAVGACIVERHLTLSRADRGPDAAFSLEPEEFKAMVHAVRTVARALGAVRYGPTEHEASSVAHRRSLFVVKDMAVGEMFTGENLRCIRPEHGLPPRVLHQVLGRRALCSIARGTPLTWNVVDCSDDVRR